MDLMEKDLVTKANTALELITDPNANRPTNVKFIVAKKLCNGNILYQLESTQAWAWKLAIECWSPEGISYGLQQHS